MGVDSLDFTLSVQRRLAWEAKKARIAWSAGFAIVTSDDLAAVKSVVRKQKSLYGDVAPGR